MHIINWDPCLCVCIARTELMKPYMDMDGRVCVCKVNEGDDTMVGVRKMCAYSAHIQLQMYI